MSILKTSRRAFLKGACILSGGLMLGVRMAGKAYAAVRDISETMSDRINGVYGADKKFKSRASQDNKQVQALYEKWLGAPLGEKSEEHLHTKWTDKSAAVKALRESGAWPKAMPDMASRPYPHER